MGLADGGGAGVFDATMDVDDDAADPTGGVGGQEDGRAGYVFGEAAA